MELLRTCTKCGKALPLEEFLPNKNSKDGYYKQCKSCVASARKPHGGVSSKPIESCGFSSPTVAQELTSFKTTDIFAELRRRGWSGELHFTKVQKI